MISDVDASPLHPVVSRKWRLSPAYIELLLHCHCYCGPLPRPDAPVTGEGVAMLKEHGMIEESDRCDHGWTTTARGKALVQLLCETPPPEKFTSFLDPRTGRRVG
jgi:hypothetical protein